MFRNLGNYKNMAKETEEKESAMKKKKKKHKVKTDVLQAK